MTTLSVNNRVLAIDGGGTRCRFALAEAGCDAGKDPIAVVEGGPANATSDFEATVRCINDGLKALAHNASLQLELLHELPAFVGLAGVTGTAIAGQLKHTLPLHNACYTEDRVAALRGAFGKADGLIAHCGTGSFFASQINATYRFTGGWGSVLGDEASAQWIGRKALSAALQQADGFLPASALTSHLFTRFGSTNNIVSFASTATPEHFGSLAPAVTEHAQTGDPNAQQIMRAAVNYITQGIDNMGWKPGMAVCFTGGVGPHYEPYLPDNIVKSLAQPIGTPLDGAIELAFEHAENAHGYR